MVALGLKDRNGGWRSFSAIQDDSPLPSSQGFSIRVAGNVNPVLFGVPIARVGEPVSQSAIVCQQHQSLARCIQATDRKEMSGKRDQVAYGTSSPIILTDCQYAFGLVESQIDQWFAPGQRLPIHGDLLMGWIGLESQGCDSTIHFHPTLANYLFAGTSRANPGLGHQFL
jgi:hypothetical protein